MSFVNCRMPWYCLRRAVESAVGRRLLVSANERLTPASPHLSFQLQIFVASALDLTLKVYDTRMRLTDSVPTKQSTIVCLRYNPAEGTLVTGGVNGVCMWSFTHRRNKKIGAQESFLR
jgi:hypothetical protein